MSRDEGLSGYKIPSKSMSVLSFTEVSHNGNAKRVLVVHL